MKPRPKAKLISSYIHQFVVDLKISKDEEREMLLEHGVGFIVEKQMSSWTILLTVSPIRANMSFQTIPTHVLRETHRIICSILNAPELGVITFGGREATLQKEVGFFEWYDLENIYKKHGYVRVCFDLIDVSPDEEVITPRKPVTTLQMLSFFETGEHSDVLIKTAHKELKAHKIVLAARSSVFAAMFRNDMQEATTGEVTISNVRAEVVEELLHYMYSNVTTKLREMPCELYAVAHMYDVQDLQTLCLEYLLHHIRVDNAVEILKLCETYTLENVEERVLKFIVDNEALLVKRDEFLVYLKENLNVNNLTKNLTLVRKYELLNFKLFLMNFIANNYAQVIKNQDYRQMYLDRTCIDLILEIDEHVSNYITKLHTQREIE